MKHKDEPYEAYCERVDRMTDREIASELNEVRDRTENPLLMALAVVFKNHRAGKRIVCR